MKKSVLNILILLFVFNVTLLGNTVVENTAPETVEVSLNAFGPLGIVVVVVLTSLLGAFFMKGDLGDAFN